MLTSQIQANTQCKALLSSRRLLPATGPVGASELVVPAQEHLEVSAVRHLEEQVLVAHLPQLPTMASTRVSVQGQAIKAVQKVDQTVSQQRQPTTAYTLVKEPTLAIKVEDQQLNLQTMVNTQELELELADRRHKSRYPLRHRKSPPLRHQALRRSQLASRLQAGLRLMGRLLRHSLRQERAPRQAQLAQLTVPSSARMMAHNLHCAIMALRS